MGFAISDARLWAILAALALTLLAIVVRPMTFERDVYDAVVVVDITKSMNTRDMQAAGSAASRLNAAKTAAKRFLSDLPCQSRLGVGVFTERRSFLLFYPIEVCGNFAPIETAIDDLDWRMAWEGDSMVARGLHSAVAIAADLKTDLVFLTDGHEAPPLPEGSGLPVFDGEPGRVRGLIAGVGGTDKSPIPKFDDDGREVGAYGPMDVPQVNRTGAPPADAESRPGYHPKWAPFGTAVVEAEEHLTSVRAEHLAALAAQTGLGYASLASTPGVFDAFAGSARPRTIATTVDVRWAPAALALAILAAVFGFPALARRRAAIGSRETGFNPHPTPAIGHAT